jgi:FKBP-type peptidyl-prolyl cis-trans isomerase FkpA
MKPAVMLIALVALAGAACGGGYSTNTPTSPTSPPVNVPFSTVDLRTGSGTEATAGRPANVRYTGWLYSANAPDNKGSQFDSGTFTFTIGTGVIPGFSQGVTGMRVGGLRRVVIPPSLGYGSQPNGPIPANSTLIFEIELLSIQ